MKVIVKEMDGMGKNYLVYLSTHDDILVKSDIVSENELDETLLKYREGNAPITFEKYNYEQYLGQDERN